MHPPAREQFPPKAVMSHLRAHDKRMEKIQEELSEIRAVYLTQYWEYVNRVQAAVGTEKNLNQIEFNALWPFLTGYVSALYPRAATPVVSADPERRGRPDYAKLVLRKMFAGYKRHSRILTSLRQGLLYHGVGAKVGYVAGRGSPIDRTWMRVVPYWELLLDHDVSDGDDERFRGHVFWRPKSEVEAEYGLHGRLSGGERVDFLAPRSGGKAHPTAPSEGQDKASEDQRNFVRVLEFCNLVDTYIDPKNPHIVTKGRFEVYILGQDHGISDKPVYQGPLPVARPDGTPLSNLLPLIFNHVPEHPLQGVPHARRMMPQIRERNAYRTYFASASRKDVRIWMVRKGYFDTDKLAALARGDEGLLLEVEKDENRPLEDIVVAIKPAPISPNIKDFMAMIEQDADRLDSRSPNARGQVTEATAFEVGLVNQNTESEYGLHAEIKDHWLSELAYLMLRTVQAAMYDHGGSDGAYEKTDTQLWPVGAMEEPPATEAGGRAVDRIQKAFAENARVGAPANAVDSAQEEVREVESHAKPPREDTEEAEEPEGEEATEGAGEEAGESEDAEEPLAEQPYHGKIIPVILEDDNGDVIEVLPEHLEADFDISFSEGSKSPMNQAAVQQAIVRLRSDLTELWASVQKGDLFAKAYMKVMCETFDLPRELHPDVLLRAMEEQKKDAKKGSPAPSSAPASAPSGAPAPGDEQQLVQLLQRAAKLPPDKSIPLLMDLFEDNEEIVAALQQAAQMPPDQQAQVVAAIINQILGSQP